MGDSRAKELIEYNNKLKKRQSGFKSLWDECAEFCLPFSEREPGQQDNTMISERLFDETAVLDGEFFDCALHGMITNPAGTFFSWEAEDPDLMEHDEAKQFLQHATKTAHHILNNTNYHTSKARQYTHIRTYGTGPLFIEEDFERGLRFTPVYIGAVSIAENARGIIDTHFREFEYTARQAAQAFGEDNLPEEIKKQLENTSEADINKKFTFIHGVFPREDRDISSKKNTDMPFASFYISVAGEKVITEGGFFENPWSTPRWKKPWRSPVGMSPAMNILASIKMLNDMEQTNLIAGHKMIEPPMGLPESMQGRKYKDYAGGINIYDSTKGKIEPIHTVTNVAFSMDLADRRRKIIDEGFFKHVLQLPMKPDMPVIEVMERIEEQVRVLGPMVGRLFFEGMNVELDRIFGILLRSGKFGRPPDILLGQEIKVQYLSSIARAQKFAEIKAALQANQILEPFLAVAPEIKDNFDFDEISRGVTTGIGYPQTWLRSIEDRDELRAIRQQMQDEQASIVQLAQGAEVAGKLKEALA